MGKFLSSVTIQFHFLLINAHGDRKLCFTMGKDTKDFRGGAIEMAQNKKSTIYESNGPKIATSRISRKTAMHPGPKTYHRQGHGAAN